MCGGQRACVVLLWCGQLGHDWDDLLVKARLGATNGRGCTRSRVTLSQTRPGARRPKQAEVQGESAKQAFTSTRPHFCARLARATTPPRPSLGAHSQPAPASCRTPAAASHALGGPPPGGRRRLFACSGGAVRLADVRRARSQDQRVRRNSRYGRHAGRQKRMHLRHLRHRAPSLFRRVPYTWLPLQHHTLTFITTTRRPSPRQVPAERNPGVRVWPAFLGTGQAAPLLAALQPLKRDFGINLIDPTHAAIYRCGS